MLTFYTIHYAYFYNISLQETAHNLVISLYAMKQLVIFASGTGTNAENIIQYFSDVNKKVVVQAVLSNNRKAAVLEKANAHHIPAFYFNRQAFYNTSYVLDLLVNMSPDLIVLSGFLWKLPNHIINAFPGKIINLHPALLPKYGGKGMYGMHVHTAVVANREKETGITIHHVNERYDEGSIIFQASTAISKEDIPETVAQKVHALEYEHFPRVLEKLLYEKG